MHSNTVHCNLHRMDFSLEWYTLYLHMCRECREADMRSMALYVMRIM